MLMTLQQLKMGQTGIIKEIKTDLIIKERLESLGLIR